MYMIYSVNNIIAIALIPIFIVLDCKKTFKKLAIIIPKSIKLNIGPKLSILLTSLFFFYFYKPIKIVIVPINTPRTVASPKKYA